MLLKRGRNWIQFDGWESRQDGWWLFGYWAWTPRLELLPIAIWYRLTDGGNNFFYTIKRRALINRRDGWIFSWEEEND